MANSVSNVLLNIRVSSIGAKQSLSEIANGFTILQGSIALVGTQISKTAIAFEKAMREVNALAQESEVNFKKFSQEIIKLTDDPKITAGPTALAKSMSTLVGSGFEAAESIQLAGVAAKSASAGMTEAGVSVKALATLMNSYNQKTLKDAIKFSDELFRVVDKGVISYEELATNLGSVIATASTARISFKEVGAGFIELTRAGINASEAETALNNLFRSLTDITPQTAQYAKTMGIELSETALQTKGLEGVLKEMNQATGGSLELMQKLIPEARAAKAALVLAKDGASGFSRALGEMNTSAGSTDRALSQISKAYAFTIDKVKQATETLAIAYGDIVLEAIKDLTPYLKGFLDYLINLDDNTKRIIVNTGKYTLAIGAALIAIKGFLLVGTALVGFFTSLALKVSAGTVALSTFITALRTAMLMLGTPATAVFFAGLITASAVAVGAVYSVIEALKMVKAQQEENARYEALNKQKNEALKTMNEFQQKKASGKKLTADDYRKIARATAVASTFGTDNESKKRIRDQSVEYGIKSKLLDKELEDKRKADAIKSKLDAENAKKKFALAQENAKRLAEQRKEEEAENKRLAEQFKREKLDAKNDYISIQTDLFRESKRLTLSDYDYQKFMLNQEFLDKKKVLDNMKKYDIDTTEARKFLANNLNLSLKEIDKKRLEDIESNNRARKEAEKNNSSFIKDISRQTELMTADDKRKAQIKLEEQLENLKENFERTKESMLNMKDAFGKNVFTKEQIESFSKGFESAYNKFKSSSEKQINNMDFAKNVQDNIDKIKEGFEDLNDNESLLAGERIKRERDIWQNILDETIIGLKNKEKLNQEDIKKLEQQQKEAQRNILRSNRDNDKLIIQSRRNLSQALSSILSSTGLVSKDFSLLTNNTEDLNKALVALSQNGLKGLDEFAKAGGNLDPLVSAITLAITQVKELGKAIIDNLRPIEDFSDFSNMMRDMSSGLWKSVTLGLYDPKEMEKLTGIKSNEDIRRITEERIKLIKDEEEAVRANYELQRKTIKETVFDSEERNVKLKVLENQLTKDLEEILKKRDQENKERLDKIKEYNLTITKLSFDNESIIYNEADKAIKQLGISFTEINKNTDDALQNEKEKLIEINKLSEKLFDIRDSHFDKIEKLMSKYYEQEKKHILANYKTELQTIKDKEKKIKENEKQLAILRAELEKIEKEFAKKLEDKNLTKTAVTEFNTARNEYMSNNVNVSSLIATPTTEFEMDQEAQKEKLDILLEQGLITAEEHANKLKELALVQNIYWTEISKNLVVGTREYDEAVKKANDGFRDYKESVKDSLQAQKKAQIETFNTGTEVVNLTEKINTLTDENETMRQNITDTKLVVDSALDSLDLKFKEVTGGWVTDINSVTSSLSGISTGAQTAIADLNKLKESKKLADETINKFGLNTSQPATTQQLKKIEGDTATRAANDFLTMSNSFLSSMKPVTAPQIKKVDPVVDALKYTTNLFSNLKFSDGGISQGPKSGYPAVLHGKELILNEAQGDNLAEIFRLANTKLNPNINISNGSDQRPNQIIINGSGLNKEELISATTQALKNIDRQRRNSYA